ncbi:MAG: sulfatase [Deltaproteobacteria bacterium]|nr:sulfatase [Deltaproteobacteria bacterium]
MIAVSVVLTMLAGALAGEPVAARAKKPNVIFISIDTLAADHTSLHGYFRDTTPFLKKLASENVMFENCISQAAYTLASHTSMFTGLYVDTHQVVWQHGEKVLGPEHKTLAERLKAAGYRTVWMATTTSPMLSLSRGLGRGFETVHDTWLEMGDGLKKVKTLLKTLPGEKPFFLFLHTYMLHDPYHPVAPYDRVFDPGFRRHIELAPDKLENLRIPRNLEEATVSRDARIRNNFMGQFNLKYKPDHDHFVALYDGGIRTADDAMKEIFATFRKIGVYNDSLIVVTSDHGETFGDYGYYFHYTPTHQETHVPLIMRIPGAKPARVSQMALGIDLLPTILDVLGIDPGAGPKLEGRSLLPALQGKTIPRDEYVFSHGLDHMDAVWDSQWKLVHGHPEIQDIRLYDVKADALERHDLSARNPGVVAKLKSVLDARACTTTPGTRRPSSKSSRARTSCSKTASRRRPIRWRRTTRCSPASTSTRTK